MIQNELRPRACLGQLHAIGQFRGPHAQVKAQATPAQLLDAGHKIFGEAITRRRGGGMQHLPQPLDLLDIAELAQVLPKPLIRRSA